MTVLGGSLCGFWLCPHELNWSCLYECEQTDRKMCWVEVFVGFVCVHISWACLCKCGQTDCKMTVGWNSLWVLAVSQWVELVAPKMNRDKLPGKKWGEQNGSNSGQKIKVWRWKCEKSKGKRLLCFYYSFLFILVIPPPPFFFFLVCFCLHFFFLG